MTAQTGHESFAANDRGDRSRQSSPGQTSLDTVCGINPVSVLLERAPGRVVGLYVDSASVNRRVRELVEKATALRITVHRLPRDEIGAMAGGERHQGVVARQELPLSGSLLDLEDLLANVTPSTLVLVLDGVQDPHNLGACLRSADAAGVDAVIVPRDRSSPVTPVVHRASAGASHTLPVYRVSNLARMLERLKDAGIWLAGADSDAGPSLYDIDLTGPLALVVGGEGRGLRRLTREACDHLARIPMQGTVPSLNVSVATAVMLFEVNRQRSAAANRSTQQSTSG